MSLQASNKWDEWENSLIDAGYPESETSAYHGFFTALHVGPVYIEPETWLPVLLNPQTSSEVVSIQLKSRRELLLDLLRKVENDIRFENLDPYFNRMDLRGNRTVNLIGWCRGFLNGLKLGTGQGLDPNDILVQEMLMPILFLSNPEEFREQFVESENDFARAIQSMGEMIPSIIPELEKHWRVEKDLN